MLKELFLNLASNYSNDQSLLEDFWKEIELNYSHKKRHYHSLTHLENMYQQLFEVKEHIVSWETILFSLFYHDIVYNATKSDNEEESSKIAEERMNQLNVPKQLIEACKLQILATKSHSDNSNSDINYFLDADLSVLGQDFETYKTYYQNVRKEYSIYPSLIFNPGRKKVLNHFLAMERIFKTDYFYAKFEKNAKINLQKEIDSL